MPTTTPPTPTAWLGRVASLQQVTLTAAQRQQVARVLAELAARAGFDAPRGRP